jgi:hypothetical protein
MLRSLPLKIVSLALIVCGLPTGPAAAQNAQSPEPYIVGGSRGLDGTKLEETTSHYLDLIAKSAARDKSIIMVARLGDGESSRGIIRRRLSALRDYFVNTRRIAESSVIAAEGERVRGLGQVEVYVGGRLFVVFRMRRNRDFVR